MDEGDSLYQEEIDILDTDNTSIMFDKLSKLGSSMIREFIPKLINGEITPIKQDNSKATYAYNISKEDEKIDIRKNTTMITRDYMKEMNKVENNYL